MAKPTSTFKFAFGENATSNPGPARMESGFQSGQRLPAKWLNYVLNGFSQWAEYLNGLHTDPAFLGKEYAWANVHSFGSGLTSQGYIYAPSFSYDVKPVRTIMIPLTNLRPIAAPLAPASTWVLFEDDSGESNISQWVATTTNDRISVHLALPHTASLRRVRAWVQTTGMAMGVERLRHNKATGETARDSIALATRSSDGVLDSLDLSGSKTVSDRSMATFRVTMITTAESGHGIRWLEVQYVDPGPSGHH